MDLPKHMKPIRQNVYYSKKRDSSIKIVDYGNGNTAILNGNDLSGGNCDEDHDYVKIGA